MSSSQQQQNAVAGVVLVSGTGVLAFYNWQAAIFVMLWIIAIKLGNLKRKDVIHEQP